MNDNELIDIAIKTLNPRELSKHADAGSVGSALLTDKGNVYTGVCIDSSSSMGFCAEHAAIAAMVTAGENKIEKIVAVDEDKSILPPCGRCREFIWQMHPDNKNCDVILSKNIVKKLHEILPFHWYDRKENAA